MKRNNWTDRPCYYVSVIDGRRKALLVGPFAHQRQAAFAVDKTRRAAEDIDAKAAFYSFGTAKAATGHREGSLNGAVSFDTMAHRPRQYAPRIGRYGF